MKIAVLGGGLSSEREVSIASAYEIHDALIDKGHKVVFLDIYGGYEDAFDNLEEIFTDKKKGSYEIAKIPPKASELKENRVPSPDGFWGVNIITICKYADLVFIALHGAEGENGKVQAAFDLFGIKYTGTGYFGSALALDKHCSKQIMVQNQIITPDWEILSKSNDYQLKKLKFPVVIKPVSEGSSIGVSIVKNQNELTSALVDGIQYGECLIAEEYIIGKELSVGILNHQALPVIEILPKAGFFNYHNKYQSDGAKEICPAELSMDITLQLQKTALKVHEILGLGIYSRIDFIYGVDKVIHCLEANTLPGMTSQSLLPKEAKAKGNSFADLCDDIVRLTLADEKYLND